VSQAADSRWAHLLEVVFSPAVLAGLTGFSLALCFGSVVVVSWSVCRLPEDYLVTNQAWPRVHGWARVGRFLRNLLALLVLLVGVLLLVLPGQGLLTILAGCLLLDAPGKRRLELRLMQRPRVLAAINKLRQRRGRPPLSVPERAGTAHGRP
jgi:hypothetical protein